ASDLTSTAPAVMLLAFLPVEDLGAAIKSLAQACGCDSRSRAILRVGEAEQGAVRRDIDFPNRGVVQSELSCGPAHQRLEHRDALHAARATLRAPRRCIGGDRKATEPQRHRLIEERGDERRDLVVALPLVRTAILDDEEVHRRDAAVLAEANLH